MMAENTQLEIVKFDAAHPEEEDHDTFKKQIKFFTKKNRQ